MFTVMNSPAGAAVSANAACTNVTAQDTRELRTMTIITKIILELRMFVLDVENPGIVTPSVTSFDKNFTKLGVHPSYRYLDKTRLYFIP